MQAIVTAVLALLAEIAPAINATSSIAKIIDTLTALLPALAKEVSDLYPIVKNVIATLKGNAAVTPEQLDSLDQIEAKIDADYDAASAAAKAEDDAAGGASPPSSI